MARYTTKVSMFSPAATTTGSPVTSTTVDVSERKKLSIELTAASITSGNCVFTFFVSNDGTNFVAYNRITTNVTNTNAQNDARVASVTLSSNGSAMAFFPVGDHFNYVYVVATVTTDGSYTATLASID